MDCRGCEVRKRIVKNYDVEPLAHIKLLNGTIVHSDAGSDIIDSYFVFKCTEKKTGKHETIYCGRPTAEDFCKLTGKRLPAIFNPLQEHGKTSGGSLNERDSKKIRWNPVRKELYNATMLLIVAWNAKPDSVLYSIKDEIEKQIDREPCISQIKSINTILCKGHTTMKKVLHRLEAKNEIKKYSF